MLFEPCGDLLKDYGAYCETLRVTEREEVYSAIHTRTVTLPNLPSTGGDGRTETEEGRGGAGAAAQPASPKTTSPRIPSRTGAKDAAGSGRRKSSSMASTEAAGGAAALSGVTEAPAVPFSLDVALTSIVLHYPVFCLNQRDMTPLCRAIPHCPSLLSIELVGCGLSVQSYMKLVEAVYRSPRVVSVAVDFNIPLVDHTRQRRLTAGREAVEAGFVVDPTLHPPSYSVVGQQDFLAGPLLQPDPTLGFRGSLSSAASQDRVFNASAATVPPQRGSVSVDYTLPTVVSPPNVLFAAAAAAHSRDSSAGKASDELFQAVGVEAVRLSQISNADAAGAAGIEGATRGLPGVAAVYSSLAEDESAAAVLYLYPTQYCGLDQLPTPLELQIQEEKEKKGKVDGKKVQQLQAQRETLRAFDQQHRVPVPRSWDGVLFTGIHSLSLRGNHVDDTTASRLAQVLTDHTQSRLVSLNLWGNDITDVGAAALARMLRGNHTLQVLDLGNNGLSDAGMLELVRVFLMQQLTSPEDILAARKAYLTRRGATEEEQRAATQPLVLTEIPSYEDLYAHWWHTQQQKQQQAPAAAVQASSPGELSLSQPDLVGSLTSARPATFAAGFYPAPPSRDTQPSPTAVGNANKRAPPVKNKVSKSESVSGGANVANATAAAFHMTLMSTSAARAANRHTIGFDKDCVRVRHIADNDAAVRIPGNTVLEVLNLEENRNVTVTGVREVVRLLRLHEPAEAAEMLAMMEVREPHGTNSGFSTAHNSMTATSDGTARRGQGSPHRSAAAAAATPATTASAIVSPSCPSPTGPNVINAPELHCAGLRLRACGVRSHRASNRASWADMDAAQEELNRVLTMWGDAPQPTA